MRDETVLDDPKRWKAVSHPLRLAILKALGERDMTNEELARTLGKPSGALFYHTKRLLEAGLIEPAGTRQKGPLTEKLYRRAAPMYRIPLAEDGASPPLGALMRNAVEVYENVWRTRVDKDFDQVGFNLVLEVSPEVEREFFAQVRDLHARFAASSIGGPDTRLVSLTMLIHRVSEPEP